MTKKKILVIEDDNIIREMLRELLELEGFVVVCAENGSEGILALRWNKPLPNLILLDLAMPVKDGFQFRIEQEQDLRLADVPVIVMTAAGNTEAQISKMRAMGYVKKPFDVDQIVNLVRQYCS